VIDNLSQLVAILTHQPNPSTKLNLLTSRSSAMKTSTFLSTLRAHPGLPVVFRTGAHAVSPRYHLTEVKRVSYETMDCGAMTHRWTETQFELWVPPLVGGLPGRDHLSAGKFIAIIDRVEKELLLAGDTEARIHVSLGDHPAALYDIASLHAHEGRLWVELTPDRTRCKAAERRVAALTGGCCGTKATETAPATTADRDAGAAAACCGAAAAPAKDRSSCCV
jgi:hypothetical protein